MSNPRGFTLVEMLVSLLVFSVGLLATLSAFTSSANSFAEGHSYLGASAGAAMLLERVRAEGCDGALTGSMAEGTVLYTWNIDADTPESRRVTVVVSSDQRRIRADTFSTMISC